MQIDELSTTTLAEMMGTEADDRDARIMMSLLTESAVTDTDDLSDSAWIEMLNKTQAIRRNEDECNAL